MLKTPSRMKKVLLSEIKKFKPLVQNLISRGKESSEDDARILINDILSDMLGYDKYNELRTEHREKNGRLDYAIKLTDGPNANKDSCFDFVIEAKACHVSLNDNHINQTLAYCLTMDIRFFILTNVGQWKLYFVNKRKKKPEAQLIHSFDFYRDSTDEMISDELYVFTRDAYLNDHWKVVKKHKVATDAENVVAIILSDKVINLISKELGSVNNIRINKDQIKDIIEKDIVGQAMGNFNKKLLKQVNSKATSVKNKSNNKIDTEVSNENNNDIQNDESVINVDFSSSTSESAELPPDIPGDILEFKKRSA